LTDDLKGVRRLGTVDTSWLQGRFDATERLGRRMERFEASIENRQLHQLHVIVTRYTIPSDLL
jgi:hypothetical protein